MADRAVTPFIDYVVEFRGGGEGLVRLYDGEDLDILLAETYPFRYWGDPEIEGVYRADRSDDD